MIFSTVPSEVKEQNLSSGVVVILQMLSDTSDRSEPEGFRENCFSKTSENNSIF